ncbi:hypothetical protein LZ31DRAFT_32277 [Colletotrichum somersetense]|nr:hypothetical protein LZ31DRAFT_32277 [Colletotrichum somersetense]
MPGRDAGSHRSVNTTSFDFCPGAENPGCLTCEHRDDTSSATTPELLRSFSGGQYPPPPRSTTPKPAISYGQQQPVVQPTVTMFVATRLIRAYGTPSRPSRGELDLWLVLAKGKPCCRVYLLTRCGHVMDLVSMVLVYFEPPRLKVPVAFAAVLWKARLA